MSGLSNLQKCRATHFLKTNGCCKRTSLFWLDRQQSVSTYYTSYDELEVQWLNENYACQACPTCRNVAQPTFLKIAKTITVSRAMYIKEDLVYLAHLLVCMYEVKSDFNWNVHF